MNIHVYHGPNLNRLESRDSEEYGSVTLDGINGELRALGDELGVEVDCRQSNSEGTLVDWVQSEEKDGLVLNAAAYTHTSVALRDAVDLVEYPTVEVHLSNIHAREVFRSESRLAPVCLGQVSGFGPASYRLGLRAVVDHLRS